MPTTQSGLQLLLGPDRYRKRQRVDAIIAALHLNLLDWDGASAHQLTAATLMQRLRQQPIASPMRLVIIDEAHRLDRPCVDVLHACVAQRRGNTCVILLTEVEIGTTHPLRALWTQATIEQFSWLAPAEVGQWIHQQVTTAKKRIAEAAVCDVVQAFGADLARIQSLLDQLMAWIGSRPAIEPADVRVFVPDTAMSRRYDLVQAIAHRDAAEALAAIESRMVAGQEVVELIGLVAWQLQRWLTVKRLQEAGLGREQVQERLALQPWQLERLERETAGRSVEELHQFLEQCWRLDVAAKTGRVIPRVGLEQLVVALCLPTTPRVAAHGELTASQARRW